MAEAAPQGCRIHLTGGEPFGDWPRLIEICRRSKKEAIQDRAPLDKVETSAFWATDGTIIRERLRALDACGMRRLVISADPYHQEFVPIERCRLVARVAEEVLGAARVQVRWRDWLAEGVDVGGLPEEERVALFARYASRRRERFNGRAAEVLAERLRGLGGSFGFRPAESFADVSCADALVRSRHVHVDPCGRVMPGTCAGIVIGQAGREPPRQIWRQFQADHDCRPVVGTLCRQGPAGLMSLAGLRPSEAGYAGKCHLCWEARKALVRQHRCQDELAPAWLYGVASPSADCGDAQHEGNGPICSHATN